MFHTDGQQRHVISQTNNSLCSFFHPLFHRQLSFCLLGHNKEFIKTFTHQIELEPRFTKGIQVECQQSESTWTRPALKIANVATTLLMCCVSQNACCSWNTSKLGQGLGQGLNCQQAQSLGNRNNIWTGEGCYCKDKQCFLTTTSERCCWTS